MGVNALAKATNIPLSSMQHYLHKQSYFKMNSQRKWDLPDRVLTNNINEAFGEVDTVIQQQVAGISSLATMLITQVNATVALLSAQKPIMAPVANKTEEIHPKLRELNKRLKSTEDVFKKFVKVCPEEYQDLIKNLDLYELSIVEGSKSLESSFSNELTLLFTEQATELSDETLVLLTKYQKES